MTTRIGIFVAAVSVVVCALSGSFRKQRAHEPPAAATTAQPAAPAATSREPKPEPQHPRTAERERIQHENQVIGALNDAVDLHDIAGLRRLIVRYRELDPSDEQGMQAGYAHIADCLQYPGQASRTSAQAYYDLERASTLRRYVRRACLE